MDAGLRAGWLKHPFFANALAEEPQLPSVVNKLKHLVAMPVAEYGFIFKEPEPITTMRQLFTKGEYSLSLRRFAYDYLRYFGTKKGSSSLSSCPSYGYLYAIKYNLDRLDQALSFS